MPDRIQAATYLAAVAVAGGELTIRDARAEHMENLLARFADMGLELSAGQGVLHVAAEGRLRSIDVQTLPYPGIATDYKPLVITMLSVADDVGIVTENLYPGASATSRSSSASAPTCARRVTTLSYGA